MMRKYHREWQTYDTINMSIGQGMVLDQSAPARNDGEPAGNREAGGSAAAQSKPVVPQTQLAVDQDHLDFIRAAMAGVVDHGTAAAAKLPLDGSRWPARPEPRRSTILAPANVATTRQRIWKLRDHSLFMAFVPSDNPQYAVGAIVEHGGFGASVAAPLVRDTSCFYSTGKRRSAPLLHSNKASAARSTSASHGRPPPGARPTGFRRFLPSRHDHFRHHPFAARAASLALDLPCRCDRKVRSRRALFGRRGLGSALGG